MSQIAIASLAWISWPFRQSVMRIRARRPLIVFDRHFPLLHNLPRWWWVDTCMTFFPADVPLMMMIMMMVMMMCRIALPRSSHAQRTAQPAQSPHHDRPPIASTIADAVDNMQMVHMHHRGMSIPRLLILASPAAAAGSRRATPFQAPKQTSSPLAIAIAVAAPPRPCPRPCPSTRHSRTTLPRPLCPLRTRVHNPPLPIRVSRMLIILQTIQIIKLGRRRRSNPAPMFPQQRSQNRYTRRHNRYRAFRNAQNNQIRACKREILLVGNSR